ncbi:uncharacterized protein LOC106880184 [Octopus bimaculoides]|uniref:Uncharacterized protein n=1 Tax=Octopus bimaculoides TaxID=37653 RepID=A0A0L8FZF8_OCTBM|nr:uncharacterized protein LOC106880184 [Octopus bimaculoides]XP_052828050.1 uncharacterized protein LOC106880184 [Octopus bimaculoides]|eukprot:XP_014785524.1 PREDICTED: uncharacterized protein LOC106880184 [Octopus bimaculoides]
MIELCTKKRMAIAIIILISASVVTVVVESKWSSHHVISKEAELSAVAQSDNTSTCVNGYGTVINSCVECTAFELKLERRYCQETGLKTLIRCPDGRHLYKNCPADTWKEEKKFLLFECLTTITGLLSYAVVRYRQRRLDHLLMEKINRQIAAGL